MATAEQVEMVMEGLSMLDVHLQVPCPSVPIISSFRPYSPRIPARSWSAFSMLHLQVPLPSVPTIPTIP